MTLIVKEKTAANELAVQSATLKVVLEKQQEHIASRRIEVEEKLGEAKPKLLAAQQSVESINPSALA